MILWTQIDGEGGAGGYAVGCDNVVVACWVPLLADAAAIGTPGAVARACLVTMHVGMACAVWRDRA